MAAIALNAELNHTVIEMTNADLIGSSDVTERYDVVLFGDMFYDDDFALKVAAWMATLRRHSMTILVGDPGRLTFTLNPFRKQLQLLAKYDLSEKMISENHGLSQGTVWGCNYRPLLSI